MDEFVVAVNAFLAGPNEYVQILLAALNLEPEKYIFLFPADKNADIIRTLVSKNVFPTFPKLAPAITYALLLSLARFVLQHIVLKVVSVSTSTYSVCCNRSPLTMIIVRHFSR